MADVILYEENGKVREREKESGREDSGGGQRRRASLSNNILLPCFINWLSIPYFFSLH